MKNQSLKNNTRFTFVCQSLLCAIVGLLFTFRSTAQVREKENSMSQGVKSCLVIEFPESKGDDIIDAWKDFLDHDYKAKTKRDKKNDEYFTDNAMISGVGGSNTVDVYAKIDEKSKTSCILTIWFDLGGAYLSSREHPTQYDEAEKMLRRFETSVLRAQTEKELKDEEKKYKKQDDQLKRLVRDNEGLKKDIENYKEKIKKAESDIIKNNDEQETSKRLLKDQDEAVKKVRKKLETIERT
ncbi:MAG: hypothetical protein RLZZ292_14 [Bacteroidota bacterium]|jgi:translation initiation factor 2B subunit (eIF-2B alpha/beta/delta family)